MSYYNPYGSYYVYNNNYGNNGYNGYNGYNDYYGGSLPSNTYSKNSKRNGNIFINKKKIKNNNLIYLDGNGFSVRDAAGAFFEGALTGLSLVAAFI